MSRIVKVSNGDYRLQVNSGNSIILDTQSTTGKVTVIGDLDVQGALTTIETTNTQITDNILQLNSGDTTNASGITGGTAGIEIERGAYSPAQILFNESVTHYDSSTSTNNSGTFELRTKDGTLNGLQVRTITNDGNADLVFDLQGSSKALLVGNSPNYYANVTQDNHIINKKYLDLYVSAVAGVATVSSIYYPLFGAQDTNVTTGSTNILLQVNSGSGLTPIATVDSTGLTVNNILIGSDTISNKVSAHNLILTVTNRTTAGVEINGVLNLDNQSGTSNTANTPASGTTKLYTTGTEGAGRTGIYFTDTTPYGSNSYNTDELVSKNRAVLLSILL